ncbi:MAG: hypothetical protein SPM02_02485, partial [Bacteroidales bacterium]|nr:hypothetical protein [Bacteroidales bacterium]
NTVEGQNVRFPYVTGFLIGDSKDAMDENGLELYKDNYYTANNSNFGDWQSNRKVSLNVSALDMTTHTVSATIVNELFSLTDVLQHLSDVGITNESSDEEYEAAYDEGVENSRKGNITVSFSNLTFTAASK